MVKMESEGATQHKRDERNPQMYNHYEGSRGNFVILLEQQLKNIQVTCMGVILIATDFFQSYVNTQLVVFDVLRN